MFPRFLVPLLLSTLAVCMNCAGASYSLDLSGVTERQQMQVWDPEWISEQEDWAQGFEYQVDPGNGGYVSVWTGSGNPPSYLRTNLDYNQFIAAGPAAGQPVRVRLKYEHRDNGTWLSCSHGNDSDDRHHYEVSMQATRFRIYKFWGPGPGTYASVAETRFSEQQGAIYWIYLTEIRENNDPNGNVTISGELWDENLTTLLSSISVTDNGDLAGQPVVPSSNKRGFGGYFEPDGNGAKVIEWHVEPLVVPLDYATWQLNAFLPSTPEVDKLAAADADGDGLPNGIEFYLGLDPVVPDPSPLGVRLEGDNVIATYQRKLGRFVSSAEVQLSGNLAVWSSNDAVENVVGSDGDVENVEVVFPATNIGFLRLGVSF